MGRDPRIVDQAVVVDSTGRVRRAAERQPFRRWLVADEEIALDLQILASLLPKARIVVYFAGNTIQSLVGAINQAHLR